MKQKITRNYRIAKYPFDVPSANRFCVVDAATGKILDDAQGWGFRTVAKAKAAWEHRLKQQENSRPKINPQFKQTGAKTNHTTQAARHGQQTAHRVFNGSPEEMFDIWCSKNRSTASAIKDLFQFSARSGLQVKPRDIEELLTRDGATIPCPMREFLQYWL